MLKKVALCILTNGGRNFSTKTSIVQKTSSNNRCAELKRMLLSPQLEFIMEAHSALSAKIVEETGFKVSQYIFLRSKNVLFNGMKKFLINFNK